MTKHNLPPLAGSATSTRLWFTIREDAAFFQGQCNLDRVHTENSFQNSQTFHRPLQYGVEKQHAGTQLLCTSGKGAQPLLEPMADALNQSELMGSVFFVISHSIFFFFFFFNYCLVLGNAVSD